jgi:hypothetical protein
MIGFIITLAIFAVSDATVHPWTYVILHILFRTEEVGMVFCMLQIVDKKPLFSSEAAHMDTTKESSGTNGSEPSSGIVQISLETKSIETNST